MDDDSDIRDLMSLELKKQGHEITYASSSDEAIDSLRVQYIDLVFLDIVLAENVTSKRVVEYIYSTENIINSNIPIILMSAYMDKNYSEEVKNKKYKIHATLPKPFKKDVLSEQIDSLRYRDILVLDDDDDILDLMSSSLVKKNFRVIRVKTSEEAITSNFRLISATCESLKEKVEKKEFREDLFYRIDGFNIHLKPLKERRDDIPLLIKHFMRLGLRRVVINKDAMALMLGHEWRGNIRELRRTVEIMQTRSTGLITPNDLPEAIKGATPQEVRKAKRSVDLASDQAIEGKILSSTQMNFIGENGLKKFLEVLEDEVIEHFYTENSQKVRQTLGILKISNSSFYRIMDRIKGKKSE